MYILMNHWLAINMNGSYCLSKIVKREVSRIIFTSSALNTRLQPVMLVLVLKDQNAVLVLVLVVLVLAAEVLVLEQKSLVMSL